MVFDEDTSIIMVLPVLPLSLLSLLPLSIGPAPLIHATQWLQIGMIGMIGIMLVIAITITIIIIIIIAVVVATAVLIAVASAEIAATQQISPKHLKCHMDFRSHQSSFKYKYV